MDLRPAPFTGASAAHETDNVTWALYNLTRDRAEQNDISATHQERVNVMAARWIELRKQFLANATQND